MHIVFLYYYYYYYYYYYFLRPKEVTYCPRLREKGKEKKKTNISINGLDFFHYVP
jgi:hypothetical protein